MKQLLNLIEKSRKDLQEGYELPAGTFMKVFKSVKDPVADAVSAVLIYKGVTNSDGTKIDVEMIDSELHVMTRLSGRDSVTQHDRDIQARIFEEMYTTVIK
jgi:carboxylesterase